MPDSTTSPPEDQQPAPESTEDQSPAAAEGGEFDKTPERREKDQKAYVARMARDRDKAKAERNALQTELDTLKAQLPGADPDKALDPKAIASAARAEARAEVLKDRALDKIEVAAAKTFANPELAVRLLRSDVDQFITSDGRVDTEAINDALADFLEANPGLAATPERRFKGTGDGGVRSTQPPDLDTQIAAAAAAGDVRKQLHLQNQKMLPHIQKLASGLS